MKYLKKFESVEFDKDDIQITLENIFQDIGDYSKNSSWKIRADKMDYGYRVIIMPVVDWDASENYDHGVSIGKVGVDAIKRSKVYMSGYYCDIRICSDGDGFTPSYSEDVDLPHIGGMFLFARTSNEADYFEVAFRKKF